MKDFSDLTEVTDKKLRTLRNNLNNRLESFKKSEEGKKISPSHMLFGLDEKACKELLAKVSTEMKKRSR